eukprot:TRINITY_DN739_c0_g1_i2.p1 TRINITY_DN739_c0_g1~~TRINITY_DN739_c0_g1_i2.p1  ORF type:complete len:862 (+),score=198.18 TRINITY_DN739_c0_g1_i2:267-2588(+)
MGAGYYGPTQKRLAEIVKSLNEVSVTNIAQWAGSDAFNRVEFAHHSENAELMNAEANDSMFGIVGLGHVGDDHWMLRMLLSIIKVTFLESLVNLQEPWNTPFAKALDGITFRDFFQEQGLHRDHAELWTLAPMGINSAYPENMSLLYFLWYHAANGGILATAQDFDGSPQNFVVSPGFGDMLAIWLSKNMTNIELFLNSPVAAIDCSAEEYVHVTVRDGLVLTASHVIVATPVSQHSKIEFFPELDQSRKLLASQKMGHAVKAILRYNEAWWKPDMEGRYMLSWVTNSYESVVEWGLDCSRPSENLFALMLFINPKYAGEYLNHPEELKLKILKSFELLAHDSRAKDVVDFLLVDWNAEEFIEGGPNIVMGVNCLSEIGKNGNLLREPHGPQRNVWFAGAEFSANFTGYLEGALRSGESVAARILRKPLPKHNDTNRKTAWAGVFIYGILFVFVSLLVGFTWIFRIVGITKPLSWIQKLLSILFNTISFIWKLIFIRLLKFCREIIRFFVMDVILRTVKWVIRSYPLISHNEFYALNLFFFKTKKPEKLQLSPHINLRAFVNEDVAEDVEDDTESVESQCVVQVVSPAPDIDYRVSLTKEIRRKKRGLVLSGGGAFGAYQLGVVEQLVRRGMQWDVISGVSVGALNGSVLAMYGPDRVAEACSALAKIWLSIQGEEDIMKDWSQLGKIEGVAARKGLMKTTPLEAIVETVLDKGGLQKLRSSSTAFSVGVVCVETGDYFDVDKSNPNLNEFILASATMPFFYGSPRDYGQELL